MIFLRQESHDCALKQLVPVMPLLAPVNGCSGDMSSAARKDAAKAVGDTHSSKASNDHTSTSLVDVGASQHCPSHSKCCQRDC